MDNTRLENVENLLNRILNGIAVIRFPVLHLPTVKDWTNANHTHTSASNAGILGAGALGAGIAGDGLTIVSGALTVNAGSGISITSDAVTVNGGVLAGAGLTAAGAVLAVGAGNGLVVNADDVGLQTPGTLSVSSTSTATNSHTHAITSSSAPGESQTILSTGINGAVSLAVLSLGTETGRPPSYVLNIMGPPANAGTHTALNVQPAGHTLLATLTESPDVDFNFDRTVTWNAGNIATQRFFRIQRPAIAFSGASTVNVAATVAITGAPNAGASATLSDTYALWIQAGQIRLGDAARLDNLASAPGTPTNGGYVYAMASGGGYWKDSDGSATQFAPVQTFKRSAAQDITIPAGYSSYCIGDFEINNGFVLELASDAVMEVG